VAEADAALGHSRNFAGTSSVTKTTGVARPMSLCSGDRGPGATSDSTALPSGGATASQRWPCGSWASNASLNPSLST
jgi:hypothetical protein